MDLLKCFPRRGFPRLLLNAAVPEILATGHTGGGDLPVRYAAEGIARIHYDECQPFRIRNSDATFGVGRRLGVAPVVIDLAAVLSARDPVFF